MNSFFFLQFTYFILLFILFLFTSVILGVVKIGGPWTRSMKVVHGPGPYFDGPGPQRGSMDQESMFCTFPSNVKSVLLYSSQCYWGVLERDMKKLNVSTTDGYKDESAAYSGMKFFRTKSSTK